MKKLLHERAERIIELVEWFEEFQPNDLEQIERFMLGFRYVNKQVVDSELRQEIYRNVKITKLDKNLIKIYALSKLFSSKDIKERNNIKK